MNNKDIPTEVIIHYIVKDYQRMFNDYHSMKEEKQAYIDELLKKLSKKSSHISNLEAQNKALRQQLKQAVKECNDVKSKAGQNVVPVTPDEVCKERAMRQLDKGLNELNYLESHLKAVHKAMDDNNREAFGQRLSRVLAKTDSCIDHIEEFFKRVI